MTQAKPDTTRHDVVDVVLFVPYPAGHANSALTGWPMRGLVTLGPTLDSARFHTPANVVLYESAPHAQVFPYTSAVVTHAGHGTVIRALAHGVPLVCLPIGRDQPGNAARVAFHGTGIRLTPTTPVETIRHAI